MSDLVANRPDDECGRLDACGVHRISAPYWAPDVTFLGQPARRGLPRALRRVDHPSVTGLNTDFNPFSAVIEIEGPLGGDLQNLLELTGIQQDLLDPILGFVGALGGMFTS